MQTTRTRIETETEKIEELAAFLKLKKNSPLLFDEDFYSLHQGCDPIHLTQILERVNSREQILISTGDKEIEGCRKALSFSSQGISLTWIKSEDTPQLITQLMMSLCNRKVIHLGPFNNPPWNRPPWAVPISFFEKQVLSRLRKHNPLRDEEDILNLMTLQVVRKSDEAIFVRVGIE